MVLPGQGNGNDPSRHPPGQHMFELGVTSTDGFGRRETKTLYIPHVNNLGELGLVVSGDAPVIVYKVDPGSAAARAGVDTGDELISIGGTRCAQSRHQQVVDLFTKVITTSQHQHQQHLGSGFGGGGSAHQVCVKSWNPRCTPAFPCFNFVATPSSTLASARLACRTHARDGW